MSVCPKQNPSGSMWSACRDLLSHQPKAGLGGSLSIWCMCSAKAEEGKKCLPYLAWLEPFQVSWLMQCFFRWNCLNNNNSRLLCWTSFCSQQNAFWVSFYLLVHRRKIHPVPCHRKKGEKHGICLHHVRVWVLYSKNIK